LILPVIIAATASSCATAQVPGVLMAARASLVVSSTGLAANLAPGYLNEAKQMLERANQEFAANGDDAACRDYAYIATNKFELADVMARAELERKTLVESTAQTRPLRSDGEPTSTGGALAAAR
jgi:hypothetical protein